VNEVSARIFDMRNPFAESIEPLLHDGLEARTPIAGAFRNSDIALRWRNEEADEARQNGFQVDSGVNFK